MLRPHPAACPRAHAVGPPRGFPRQRLPGAVAGVHGDVLRQRPPRGHGLEGALMILELVFHFARIMIFSLPCQTYPTASFEIWDSVDENILSESGQVICVSY